MSFQYEAINLDHFREIWPLMIDDKLAKISVQLEKQFEAIVGDEEMVGMHEFIKICCDHKPANFEEYTTFAMIATSVELLKLPNVFRKKKFQLMSHVFNTNATSWSNDYTKVMTVSESIRKVSSNASNINHIVAAIHGYNQFTFNVSAVLLKSAFGDLMVTNKDEKTRLVKSDLIYDEILKLDYVNDKNANRILFDFIKLFQAYQGIVCSPAAQNGCLKDMIIFRNSQLVSLEDYLQKMIQNLQKNIRDQNNLNENAMMVHFIQMVLNNMPNMLNNTICI